MKDILEQPEVKAYLEDFRRNVLPNIKGSAVVMELVCEAEPDPKMCLEMGAAVLLDKPIVAICIQGRKVPQHLRRIASEVVEVSDLNSDADLEKINSALRRVVEGDA
jgi:hypothetical protein